jgi:hypothetical protein
LPSRFVLLITFDRITKELAGEAGEFVSKLKESVELLLCNRHQKMEEPRNLGAVRHRAKAVEYRVKQHRRGRLELVA